MEINSRDSKTKAAVEAKPEAPRDRRVPLKVVVFTGPVAIPGFEIGMTTCETNIARLDGGQYKRMPQPFFDPVLRTIWIEGREYPLERVIYWERDNIARPKKDAPVLPDYTIGKRL